MTLFPDLHRLVKAPALDRPPVASTTPIIKWVGGKARLINELVARVPQTYGRYFEPFAGGAALFFRLAPARAVLSDANADLINTYREVACDVEGTIERLGYFAAGHSESQYLETRRIFNEERDRTTLGWRAAAFIYLNKTCFNGLWRVNKSGKFNVPMGKYVNPTICNATALRAASAALARAELRSGDYRAAVADAEAGDFVYFDPPYHDTFTAYTAGAFGEAEQRQLAETARDLVRRGAHVLLSNSDTPLIRELYADFRIDEVQCGRAINSDGAGRAAVTELLISGRTNSRMAT